MRLKTYKWLVLSWWCLIAAAVAFSGYLGGVDSGKAIHGLPGFGPRPTGRVTASVGVVFGLLALRYLIESMSKSSKDADATDKPRRWTGLFPKANTQGGNIGRMIFWGLLSVGAIVHGLFNL